MKALVGASPVTVRVREGSFPALCSVHVPRWAGRGVARAAAESGERYEI